MSVRRMMGGARTALLASSLVTASLGQLVMPRVAAASPAGVAPPTEAALVGAFAAGHDIPAGSVGAVRHGSLHVASTSTAEWATADFLPPRDADASTQAEYQDGAAMSAFERAPGAGWALVGSGPTACARRLPRTLQAACAAMPTRSLASMRTAAGAARPVRGGLAGAIARIALDQVGAAVTPTVTSFNGVDCDPYTTLVGPPFPNDNGCGYDGHFKVVDQNEPWCSDFAKWVWEQAGVTADLNLINAGASSFYSWGVAQGQHPIIDPSTPPAVGDAVVFFPPGAVGDGSYADHVGIVTGVNPDGTVNLVNGDFLGSTTISVQYNPNVALPTWSSQVWGQGEQWAFVTPPPAPQQPAPQLTMTGPSIAVASSDTTFDAKATTAGGSITTYAWTFADSQYGTALGATVTHAFRDPGLHTVAVTATSSTGTVTTRTINVDVVAPSSAVSSTPHGPEYYTVSPVHQQLFLADGSGALAQEQWDGTSWSASTLPGVPAPAGTPGVLTYPDSTDTLTPHVFFDSTTTALTEAVQSGGTWQVTSIPGQPSPGTPVVATLQAAGQTVSPDLFYVGTDGQLATSRQTGSTWQVQDLPGRPAPGSPLAVAMRADGSTATPTVFSRGATGAVAATSFDGHGWHVVTVSGPDRPAPGTGLAALTDGADPSQLDVFFTDTAGQLVEATSTGGGGASAWHESVLPGTPSTGGGLQAVDSLTGGVAEPQVFYVEPTGSVGHTFAQGALWASEDLPATAGAVIGVGAYPLDGSSVYAPPQPGEPIRLYITSGSTVQVAQSTGGGATWTVTTLPGTASGQPLLHPISNPGEEPR